MRTRGFTLIELMAVVLIMGLMLALFIPSIGSTGATTLRNQAREMAAFLELARQRAVLTGKPHRLLLDVERGAYRVEWYVSELPEGDPDPEAQPGSELLGGQLALPGLDPLDDAISLEPPIDETLAYRPVPDRFGGFEWLQGGLFFEGVDTPDGWLDEGDVAIVFLPDGSTDPAQIVIADGDERSIALEVRPLLETVRIHDVEG